MRVIITTETLLRIVDDAGFELGEIFVPCHDGEIEAARAIAAAIYTEPGIGWQPFKGEAEQLPIAYKSWLESNDDYNSLGNLLKWLEISGIELSTLRAESERLLREAACLA